MKEEQTAASRVHSEVQQASYALQETAFNQLTGGTNQLTDWLHNVGWLLEHMLTISRTGVVTARHIGQWPEEQGVRTTWWD